MRNQVFKKLFSVLLALIMVAGLLPASVLAEGEGNADSTPAPTEAVQPTESAEPTEPTKTETPEVTEVPEPTPENPAATVEPTQGEPTAEPTDEGIMPANVMPVQANVELQYRIVHLDCGRKYFSKDWIIALMHEAKAAGYNQVQLAFGNKGLRFLLKDMSVNNYDTQAVTAAIQAGNEAYYDAGEKNELTEAEMNDIFAAANEIGIEIVPLFNTPFHMEAVITAMGKLNIQDAYYGNNKACLNLSNDYATAFVKALMQKYITYFQGKGCKYFNFGADEYTGGWNSTFYNYANEIVSMISAAGMNARIFNDSFRSDSNNGYVNNAQVCYWSSNSGYASTATVYNYAKEIINTNQDFYYVVNKDTQQSTWSPNSYYAFSGSFDETTWVNYAKNFSNTTYKNFAGYNNGAESITPVGSMFCIWCDNPSHKDETQIAKEIRMILRVIGARMQNSDTYSTSDVLVEGGFKADGTINTSGSVSTPPTIKDEHGREGKIDVAIGTSTRIYLPEGIVATWTVTEGKDVVELVAVESDAQKRGEQVVEFADAAPIIGNAVMVKTLKAGTATVIATLEDGTAITATVEVTDNAKETITVVVGKSFEKTIDGKYDGTYNTDKPEIATVTAEYSQTAGVTHYEKATLSAGTFFISNNANDTNPTVTVTFEDAGEGKYYIKNSNGEYIYPNATYAYYWRSWSYSLGYGKQSVTITSNEKGAIVAYRQASSSTGYSSTTTYLTLNNSGFGASGNRTNLYIYTQRVEQGIDQTKLTFTGHKEGTTTVTIAGVEYTIEVKAADLENVVLPINLWITNTGVVPTNWSNGTPAEFSYDDTAGNRRSIYTLKASYPNVNSRDGIELSSILQNKTGTAKSWDNKTYDVVYWKSAYHTAENRQSTAGWTNTSHKGTKFEYIRFFERSWAYSVDGITWVNIENVGAGATDTDKNQVCIWYRQVTTVTDEVTTEIVDWGPIQYSANQCLLDFAVKYDGIEGGGMKPKSFPVTGKTMGFDCPINQQAPFDNGYVVQDNDKTYYRVVHGIAGVETAQYEVYMITLTPSSDNHSTSITNYNKYEYKGTEKIAWAKTEADANSAELYKMSNVKYGGEPFLESVKIYQYQGLLVTYYLRAKQTPDSLTVHYAIQGSETAFYEYNIAVNKGTTFNSGIALDHSQDPYVGGPLLNGRVTNSNGETITVSSNLATLQGLEPQYRYSKYEIVGFRKDDKNVWIYYTFTREYTYVIDFGLPLKIKFSDFGVTDDEAIDTVSLWEKEIVHENKGLYGTAKVITGSTEGKYVLYTLDKPLDKNITIPLYVKFKQRVDNDNNKPQRFTANIIPATNVYYEDSFAKFTNGSYNGGAIAWEDAGTKPQETPTQALEALGNKTYVYGYDPKYDSCTMFSMGSARKVNVTSDMAKDGVVWPTAQFTFKGTGFDIISLTDNTSGAIFVDVVGKTKGITQKLVVNNYYGYDYDATTGEWKTTDKKNPNTLYQIPVMAVRDLEYDEYDVTIRVAYGQVFDKTGDSKYSFWLDAVRVYNPMGESKDTGDTYKDDNESFPQYIKLRDAIVDKNASLAGNGALFIDGGNTANIATYANIGPNNEVYLANGQAIMFKLTGNLDKIAAVQISAKSPNSNETNKANMVIGDSNKQLSTATEMYYDITDAAKNGNAITITNNGNAILSLTNLKITFKEQGSVSLGAMNAEEQAASVMAVRALFASAPIEPKPEPEPEKTFEPERFEASWSRNVMQGRKATLTVKTSEDVEAITVDGQTIRSYRTRTERVGFGRRAKRITYREFTYSMVAQESANFSVTAINAEGTESEAITARLTVQKRPESIRDVWNWFKGWF